MRESNIPLTANAPATFNRCVTHFLRPVREFSPSYFDDVFVLNSNRSVSGNTDIEMRRAHLWKFHKIAN
ncbi:Uncharacterized protein PHPALM_17015 [Phytophthora palmivora]|uniref:Reverse transcriptase n=1 Tax=Phytophthora palmivora TaxID=4796 RepID=A0A2P4XNB9_9STRA|nr:Uncharacterized protein PHPALM_17015 [Phytophthora palmivora]